MRFVSCGSASIVLALVLAGATPALAWDAATSLSSVPAPPGLRLVWESAPMDPASTLDRLEDAGFRVAVAIPPHLYYVHDEGSSLSILPAGCAFRDPAPAAAGKAPAPWRPPQEAIPSDYDPFQGREDAFPPPRQNPARGIHRAPAFGGLPYGARWTDTSEFMIGRVAVSILLPESDGTTDPDRYDWTPALRDSVVRSAVRGLAGWSAFAAARGIPLSFALEVHPGLATRYEPIDRTIPEEDLWIADMLTGFLGYRGDVLTLSYDVANAARARLGAQWSVLLIGVQNDTDPDGAFPDGFISHARLGGPYFITPVNNLNTTSASLDFYIRHEIAHSFWALDEHFPSSGWWACQLSTGYFNQPNFNSVVPAPGYCGYRRGCLMYANQPDSLCDYTQRQVGWADRDLTGAPDLLETKAHALPDSVDYRAVAGPPIILRGKAVEGALRNQNPYHFFLGDTISAATIDSVVYRVDGGPWIRAQAVDGVYDAGLEFFTATIPPLPPGTYLVEWTVWNTNGLSSQEHATTLIQLRAPTGPPGAGGVEAASGGVSLRFGPTPSGGPVRFTLTGRPGASGWATVHDVHGRQVARRHIVVPSSGIETWTWSARVPGGTALPSGLYFLTVDVDGASLKRRLVLSH